METRVVSEGDPASDVRAFRRCLGEFATGVTIVTTEGPAGMVGLTANSFSSLSLDPPLILWSIGRSSRSFSAFENAREFAVNILATDQVEASRIFSSSETDKFAGVKWRHGTLGSPILEGVVSVLECRTEKIVNGGDHLLIIGRVAHYVHYAGVPLIFAQGQYSVAREHPALKSKKGERESLRQDGTDRYPFLTLLSLANSKVQTCFEKQRKAEGVTLTENKVLVSLYANPGIEVEKLAKVMYFGRVELEDALAELSGRGDIVRDQNGRLHLSDQGRARRVAIMERANEFGDEILHGVSQSDIECVKRVLRAIEASTSRIAIADEGQAAA